MKQSVPGFVKSVRTVCKAEWAYEVSHIFADLESFKNYKGSKFFDDVTTKVLDDVKKELGKPVLCFICLKKWHLIRELYVNN